MAGLLTRQEMNYEVMDNMAKGALTLQSGVSLSDRVNIYLNRAQIKIARKDDFLQATATASTVADQQTYSFPSNFRSIYTLRFLDGIDSRKLTCVMPSEMDARIPDLTVYTSQRSWFYVPYKETMTFQLFPVPPDIYTLELRYSYFPTALTASDQTSDYTNLDDALVAFATMYGFQWMQELKDAAYWKVIGDEIVRDHKLLIAEEYPDWSPYSEGFTTAPRGYTGDYWNNPFVRGSGITEWSGR